MIQKRNIDLQHLYLKNDRPQSGAVIYGGKLFEIVLTAIDPATGAPVPGGIEAETRCIFERLDAALADVGLRKEHICTATIYLQDVLGEVQAFNRIWTEYFDAGTPCRRCVGVQLQGGMRIETIFTAEFPAD